MSEPLFQRPLLPVANQETAAEITAGLVPHVDAANGTVIAVHVIEKAGGALDKASVEQRELAAQEIFSIVTDGLSDTGIAVETEILYGTDVAETIIDAARDLDASAIVFTPRGGNRWLKLVTGDVTTSLVNRSDLPVIVLPDSSRGESTE